MHLKYDDSQTTDLNAELLNGSFLIKALSLLLDPYMRSCLRIKTPRALSYIVSLRRAGHRT
jgi:hypothetical protein